jgi:hypothetical protein
MSPDFGGFTGKAGDKSLPSFLSSLNSQIAKAEIKKPEEKKTNTAAQAVKTEQQKKDEEAKAKATADKSKETAKADEKKAGSVETVTMKDLHTSLEHLNKSMTSLLNYSQQTATAAQAQIKATKSLSGNKFA